MFFRCFFCTVRLSIFERFVFASFEPLRFCKKVRFVFPDLDGSYHQVRCFFHKAEFNVRCPPTPIGHNKRRKRRVVRLF